MKMSRYRLMLAFVALAIIMLVGCNQPIGLPNEARTASVYIADVPNEDSATGHIDYFVRWQGGDDLYSRDDVVIKWGDDQVWDGEEYRSHPRSNGFSVFEIPPIENAENEIWPCTLYYRLHASSGDTNFRLVVTELSSDPRSTSDVLLFWNAWYADSIAGDICHESTGWYAIPLSTEACAAITTIADGEFGGDYYTGWITPDTATPPHSIWCWVWGANTMNPPYIKITTP
jgi:hypothetical protein